MYTLKNDKLKIGVKKTGAELCKITSIKNKAEFMWHADPNVWGSFAPNLFPIIGALKDDTYIFENEKYAGGTKKLAEIIGKLNAYKLVGGGDSVSAVKSLGMENNFSHLSTGGGAALEFIEQGSLPGIKALRFGLN